MNGIEHPEKIIVKVDPDLEPLIPDFLRNRREAVNAVRDALARGDFETVRLLGHNWRGDGSAYGFDRVTQIGVEMEKAGQAGEADIVRRLADELAAYLARVEVDYN